MLTNLVFEQAIDKADCFMGINPGKSVCKLKYLFLKIVQLVPIMSILCPSGQSGLQHEVSLDNPSESVSHLDSDEGRDGFSRGQEFQALSVRLLLFEQHEFQWVKISLCDALHE